VKCKSSILYNGDCLLFIICVCYSWEMALNVGLDASLDNMQDWKGIREKAGEVNSTKAYITNDEISRCILNGCCTSNQLHISVE
jgi:hypothetical protein